MSQSDLADTASWSEPDEERENDVVAFTGTCQLCGAYWDVRHQPLCPCGGEVL